MPFFRSRVGMSAPYARRKWDFYEEISYKHLNFAVVCGIIRRLKTKVERKLLTEREILTVQQALQISPVTLAFVGDAVYSLYVRERLTLLHGGKAADLQRVASQTVSAQGQSVFLDKLLPLFTEEEMDVFRRGKNAKKATKSKSASNLEYSRSTGFEAVLGYVYFTGRTERITELLSQADEAAFAAVEEVKPFKPIHR